MNYFLAIDQGTQASRAIIYDSNGKLVYRKTKSVTLIRKENGYIEQDPLEILRSVTAVIDEALESVSSVSSVPGSKVNMVLACGLACQRSTVVACNLDGEPLSPALSWQDVRGKMYIEDLELSSEQVHQLSGLPLTPHYSASKCRWLLDHPDCITHQVTPSDDQVKLVPLSSFLLFHLVQSERFVVDHTQAQRMQLMDIQTLDWSEELTQAFQVPPNRLPACKPVIADYGFLKGTKIPVTAVCGDQNAALFGSGICIGRGDEDAQLEADEALINLGSGAFVLRLLPENNSKKPMKSQSKGDKRLLTSIAYSSTGTVKYFMEGTVNGSGNAIAWFLKEFIPEFLSGYVQGSLQISLMDKGESWIRSTDAESTDWKNRLPQWLKDIDEPPIFINTVGGLGSPWWSNSLEPHFIDSNDGSTNIAEQSVEALFVSVIESIVFLVQNNLDIMNSDRSLTVLKVSGGLSQQDGICQKLANLSQIPVLRLVEKETTARGVAWLASLQGNSSKNGSSDWNKSKTPFNTRFQPVSDIKLRNRYQQFCGFLASIDKRNNHNQ